MRVGPAQHGAKKPSGSNRIGACVCILDIVCAPFGLLPSSQATLPGSRLLQRRLNV